MGSGASKKDNSTEESSQSESSASEESIRKRDPEPQIGNYKHRLKPRSVSKAPVVKTDRRSPQLTDRELEDLESSLKDIPIREKDNPLKVRRKIENGHIESFTIREKNSIPPLTQNGQNPPPLPSSSFYEFARRRPKRTGDVRRSSSLGPSQLFGSNRYPTQQRSFDDSQKLRFSWNDRKTYSAKAVVAGLDKELEDGNEDEWTYKQTVIEGFDLEKFRKVNSKEKTSTLVEKRQNSTIFNEQMPGVPTYDRVEQQLLASIERELL